MSEGDVDSSMPERARALLDGWAATLAEVFESMADQRPEIGWSPVAWPAEPAEGQAEEAMLWWAQPFRGAPGATAWVGAARSTWEYAGVATLRAVGLETVEPAEARNTWLEILGQSLSAMARSIGMAIGREVVAEGGAEQAPSPDAREFASVSVKFTGADLPPVLIGFSAGLLEAISAPLSPDPEALPGPPRPASSAAPSRTMGLLLEIELPVSISFGKIRLPMKDVLKLTTGSIIELDRGVHEPVDVLVNQCLVARGEVVVVEGNYGVRIREIASREERLRSVQ